MGVGILMISIVVAGILIIISGVMLKYVLSKDVNDSGMMRLHIIKSINNENGD